MDRPSLPPRHRAGAPTLTQSDRPIVTSTDPAARPTLHRSGPRSLEEPAGRRVRRAVSLLLLSALAPGSAQLVRGSRRVGRVALRVWAGLAGVLVLLVLLALLRRDAAVGLLLRPWSLHVLRAVLVAVAAAWALLLLDALRLAQPMRLPVVARRWVAGLTAVLLVVGAGPLLWGARSASIQLDLVTSVFSGGDVVTDDGRMTVLLMGGDAGADRVGLRPDSLTVVSVDTASGEATMISLPRNLQHARFPESSPMHEAFPDGFGDLLNAVYTYGAEHPELYPGAKDAGAEATMDAVSGTLGLPVRYHALIDLQGFRDLVDALGGLRLTVTDPVPIGGGTSPVTGYIQPGTQRLDGYHALWYARSREGSSDYARMARQRCVLTALAAQADPVTVVRRFKAVADSAKELLTTDLPQQALPQLVELVGRRRSSEASIRSVTLAPPLITPADPDFARIHELALQALEQRPARADRAVQALGATGSTPAARADKPAAGAVPRSRSPASPC